MSSVGDTLVLILLIVVIIYFLGKTLFSQEKKADGFQAFAIDDQQTKVVGKIPSLLEKHGYEVIHSKVRVPFKLYVDEEPNECLLSVDYIAEADGEAYLVIVARGRKARLSGVTLKNSFLPYYLLFKPAGILYVDKEKGSIKLIDFEIPEMKM